MKLLHFANWVKQMNLPFIVMNIGLCVVLFWIGLKKFTPAEAAGIYPFITNSPLVSWTYSAFGKQGASDVIGVFEWLTGIGILIGNFKPKIGMIACIMGMLMFFMTTSFFITTPNAVATVDGLWGPTGMGEFLLKDITFFGVCLYLLTYFGDKVSDAAFVD
jgi:reactive chlorine resistance protein C